MSDFAGGAPDASTSWGSTIIQGIIILVLVIALILILYFVFTRPVAVPAPLSPFNYGDTVQILPAVLPQFGPDPTTPPPNQYLSRIVPCSSGSCPNCYQAQNPSVGNSCSLVFTGNKEDPNTKWILQEFDFQGNADAKQNVVALGNRFYLQNASVPDPTDSTGRVTFDQFNAGSSCWGPDRTFPIIGSGANSCYLSSYIVYFLPTTQPNLYYLLFPGTSTDIDELNVSSNNGIVTLRPWAQPDNNIYNPWTPSTTDPSGFVLNANGPLLNGLGDPIVPPPYEFPEVFLFQVIKV